MVLSPRKRTNIKVSGKTEHPPKKSPTGSCKIQRGLKPLRDKRFYLDLKNHSTASKLESNLRSLGAVVDPFIGQEVNIVVTDRPEWGSISSQNGVASPSCPSSTNSLVKPSPSPLPSPLPCFFSPAASPAGHSRGSNNSPAFDSPGETTGTTRRLSRSRAEAMLDRVRLQPQVKVRDPLTDAHKWNIPIWTLEKILKFLEKIQQAISRGSGESLSKARRTKSADTVQKVRFSSGKHFLKIEPIDRKCRPSFKDLPSWPKINLESDPGTSPFVARVLSNKCAVKKTAQEGLPAKTKTAVTERKANSRVDSGISKGFEKTVKPPTEGPNVKPVRDELLSGYCEVCKLDYSDLYEHIKTPNHRNYSRNSKNYASLDGFIKSMSLSVNDYLEKAEDKPQDKPEEKLEDKLEDISEDICAGGRQRNCSSEGRTRRSPRADSAEIPGDDKNLLVASPSPPSPPAPPVQADSAGPNANDANMRQSVDDRQLTTKMVGRKDALEVHCNGLSNHVQTRFACTKGDRENLGGLFLDERLPNAQLRRRRAISVSCRDLLQLSTNTGNEHFLRSGRGTQLSPALSDNSHPLLNSNSQQPLLSPTLSEKSHHLRPRGQLWLSTGLLAEDDSLLSRGGNGKVSTASLLVTANNCHLDKEPEDRVGERRSIRRKRLSAEEKLIEDNRGYYKVEVLNSKLRSTGYYVSQVQSVAETNGEEEAKEEVTRPTPGTGEAQGMKEPVVVRFKKIRRSELSVLSDEAENFMFGDQTKSESNSDSSEFEEEEEEDDDEDCEDGERTHPAEEEEDEDGADEDGSGSSRGKKGRPPRDLPLRRIRLKVDGQVEDASNASSSSTAPTTANGHRRYRRRRTNTETSTNDWEAGDPNLKDEWSPEKGELVCSLDKLHFSFESIPRSEVWYQTFERQDRCEEINFPIPYEPSAVLLPYQLPRQRLEPSTTRPSSLLKKRRHRPLIKLPRKSPRCHASTLAMLSSRHPYRSSLDEMTESVSSEDTKMSFTAGPTTRRSGVSQTQPATQPVTQPMTQPAATEARTCGQISDLVSECDVLPDMREIAKNVDSMLGIVSEPSEQPKVLGKGRLKKKVKGEGSSENDKDPALNYLVDPEILEQLACTCDVVANPLGGPSMDIVTLLDTYSSCGCLFSHDVDASCNSSDCGASSVGDTDRRMRKKRKRRNMTGWDKPKKKSLRREVLTGEACARSGTPLLTPTDTPADTPVPTPASTPVPPADAGDSNGESLQGKRKRKLRVDSSPSFEKGRGGVKRLKVADRESPKKEGFRKRGRSLAWRKHR